MKIKINWGTGILITIFIIVAGLGLLLSIAIRQDFDLVDKNYYQNGVQYQRQIEKIRNTSMLSEKITTRLSGKNLLLKFPVVFRDSLTSGLIYFYCPADAKNDFKVAVHPDDSLAQSVDLNLLKSGRYIMKIDWSSGVEGYYQEIELNIE